MRVRNCVVTTTPEHISVESGIERLRNKIGRLSKRSAVNEILTVMSGIYSLEVEQRSINAQFKAKAHEAQCLADSLSEITAMLLQCKTDITHILSISYENCRRIANNAIADKALRLEVFKRDSWRCLQCGSDELLSVDHKKPVVHGGGNELENLQTLCLPCNLKKGSTFKPERNHQRVSGGGVRSELEDLRPIPQS
jgi:hypothetical protein